MANITRQNAKSSE